MLLGKNREIVPERMKRLGKSRNNSLWWMCLVMKAKSNAVKNNTAQEPGMSGPLIKVNWTWSSRRQVMVNQSKLDMVKQEAWSTWTGQACTLGQARVH